VRVLGYASVLEWRKNRDPARSTNKGRCERRHPGRNSGSDGGWRVLAAGDREQRREKYPDAVVRRPANAFAGNARSFGAALVREAACPPSQRPTIAQLSDETRTPA
jgi:hypothetical protein